MGAKARAGIRAEGPGSGAGTRTFRDTWWEDRNLLPLLDRVEVPVYMGCDWQNVPLHLPHTAKLGRAITATGLAATLAVSRIVIYKLA